MGKCTHDDCGTSRKHCGYILITKEPRGCKAENCTKYVSKDIQMYEEQEQTETGKTA